MASFRRVGLGVDQEGYFEHECLFLEQSHPGDDLVVLLECIINENTCPERPSQWFSTIVAYVE